MSFTDKKGISVASGFKLQAKAPLDARFVVDTIADRDELVTINAAYEGLLVYVTADKKTYRCNGSGWTEMASGAGYTHPTTPGNKHIPAGGSSGQILKWKADGEAQWADGNFAQLDSSGKVPAAQLPSFVDDVIEGYLSGGKFYKEEAHTNAIGGENGKIYVDLPSNKTYRWSGTAFVEISASLALGETAGSAYRGDRGKIAYDHSQTAHAPANAEANVQADWNVTDANSDAFIKNKPTSLPANGGNAATVGGHTVAKDVPADADFSAPVTMRGATDDTAGAAGYAPAPAAGAQGKYLRGDGTWQTPPNTTYSKATADKDGLMSKEDKAKLDAQPQIYFASELPASAPAGSLCFLIS